MFAHQTQTPIKKTKMGLHPTINYNTIFRLNNNAFPSAIKQGKALQFFLISKQTVQHNALQ